MSETRSRWRRAIAIAGDWVRRAPITYLWLVVLLATTVVQHRVSPEKLDAILGRRSTNIANLLHDPLRAFFGSLLWLDGAYWVPYFLGFTIFLATAERWMGSRRYLAVGLAGHILATLISQGLVGAAIQTGVANPSLRYATDVGVSYFMAAVIGVLSYYLPRPWRWIYIAGAVVVFCGPLLDLPVSFTAVGHASALAIGFACYPLVRGKPMLNVDALLKRIRGYAPASLRPSARHKNS
ncbi:rhomboid-like protein [Gordonia sp. (in: high G+C Gram-positive bacteria)]|uniref:rhomboid-like protein n=2 Tax=Gordonia sp. (in: high G+C Gram-positive bacteria) TaxID=84139 RepID=UPI003C773685